MFTANDGQNFPRSLQLNDLDYCEELTEISEAEQESISGSGGIKIPDRFLTNEFLRAAIPKEYAGKFITYFNLFGSINRMLGGGDYFISSHGAERIWGDD